MDGFIFNVLIDVVEDPAGRYRLAEIAQHDGIDNVVAGNSRVTVHERERAVQHAGSFYEIPAGKFRHAELDLSVTAISVVRAEIVGARRPRTLVLDGVDAYAPTRQGFANSRELIREVLAVLS